MYRILVEFKQFCMKMDIITINLVSPSHLHHQLTKKKNIFPHHLNSHCAEMVLPIQAIQTVAQTEDVENIAVLMVHQMNIAARDLM